MSTPEMMEQVAYDMVISFMSTAGSFAEASGRAKAQLFTTPLSLRMGVVAGKELLIVAEDSHQPPFCPKTFHFLSHTLSGRALHESRAVHALRPQDGPSSDLEDVEEAYLRSGCSCSTAVPIADSQDVLGVLLLGQPAGHITTERELASLTSLAGALAPMLQQFMRRATLLQDTSMFLEKTLAQQCLHGSAPRDADCTGLDACSSGADSEEEDFDMSAYMDLSPHRRSFSDDEKLEPCESLESTFSEDACAVIRGWHPTP